MPRVGCTRGPRAVCARQSHSAQGFTLIEMMIVLVVLAIMAAITFINAVPAIRAMRVNTAYTQTLTAMDAARARATSMRRVYAVTFTLPGTITITDAVDATAPPVMTVTLPNDVSFDAEKGIPATNATAPDRLGNGQPDGPICFDIGVTVNCSNTFFFYPDGSARDAAGNVNNGVVYIARPGELLSSRAITLFGLSGRIRGYRFARTAGGGATAYWRQQ